MLRLVDRWRVLVEINFKITGMVIKQTFFLNALSRQWIEEERLFSLKGNQKGCSSTFGEGTVQSKSSEKISFKENCVGF